MANEEPAPPIVVPGERNEFAIERTVMAANRTLMAWIRTALSLISFGFTIYKFLQAADTEYRALNAQSPERLGLFLIALGTASVVMGSMEYYETLKRLNTLSQCDYKPLNYSFFIGITVGLLGSFLFITILTHTEFF